MAKKQAKKKPAKKTARKKAPTRPKQGTIPGTSTKAKRVASISKAAEKYVDLRDGRMDLGEREVKQRQLLEGLMQKHKLKEYTDPDLGLTVTIEGTLKAKVKKKKEE